MLAPRSTPEEREELHRELWTEYMGYLENCSKAHVPKNEQLIFMEWLEMELEAAWEGAGA